jgi:hypothetical protein
MVTLTLISNCIYHYSLKSNAKILSDPLFVIMALYIPWGKESYKKSQRQLAEQNLVTQPAATMQPYTK